MTHYTTTARIIEQATARTLVAEAAVRLCGCGRLRSTWNGQGITSRLLLCGRPSGGWSDE